MMHDGKFSAVGILFSLLVSLTLVACDQREAINADRIFHNANILTMSFKNGHDEMSIANAVAVKDGRIIALTDDTSQYPENWVGQNTQISDLNGLTLMPGFVQTHAHFNLIVLKKMTVNLAPPPDGGVANLTTLKNALTAASKQIPAGYPIMGIGYDDTVMEEKRHPTRADLDAVSTEHPIIIMHISFHLAVMNSKALEMAGIDADTPDPEGGHIQREPNSNRPNGVLEEAAMNVIGKMLPQPSPQQVFKTYDVVVQDLLALGYTTIVDHASDIAMEKGFEAYFASRDVPVDMIAYRRVLADTEPLATQMANMTRKDINGFKLGGIKILLDGSIQGYTGHLSQPYHVPPAGKDVSYRGYPHLPPEKFNNMLMQAYADDIPLLVHTNGDAAIDVLLDGLEKANTAYPDNSLRPVSIHAQTMRQDQLDRAKGLSLIPSFFVDHVYFWGDRHRDIFLGPDRAAQISPAGSAEDRQLIYTIHDDAPVVSADPFRTLWVAVARLTSSGEKLGADEAITRQQALKALTVNSAYQHYIETEKGSIDIGKKADMIILDGNPLTLPEAELRHIKVLETVKDGETVYTLTR
ncbi:MAG: amidohydrolase [PS1 clade bacterium]|uniref:Amidohydrolase n=1 Tax=PS1 clade bacterium TaxID=2175152 RepID=A0A368E2G8_9PROT|nr:MAG: amidohydrolase [PS1 clade bacterium]